MRGCLGGWGRMEVSCGFTALRGAHPSSPEARRWSRAAASCVPRAVVAVGHLPACLAGKQLAGAALGWAGRWAGSRRQVSSSCIPFCFLFYLIYLQLC